jgi:GxxExxY protein
MGIGDLFPQKIITTESQRTQRMNDYPESELTNLIILCAIEVHRYLGPGLLESVYEHCLCRELELRGLSYRRQVPLDVSYKGVDLDCGYRLDIIVSDKVLIELKSVDTILPIHIAQLMTYLKLSKMKVGLILNFNCSLMKDGIKRVVL